MSVKKIRVQGRRWSIIFWQNDLDTKIAQETIMSAIAKLQENHSIKYAFILHDQDKYDADDFLRYVNNNVGELPAWQVDDFKPKHFHIYLECDSKIDLSFIHRAFNESIPINYIKRINNDSMYIRYLVHLDDPNKFQYSEYNVFTNIDNIDLYWLDKNYSTCENTNFLRMVIEFVDNYKDDFGVKRCPSFKQVSKWCLDNGFGDMILKYSYFVKCLLDRS